MLITLALVIVVGALLITKHLIDKKFKKNQQDIMSRLEKTEDNHRTKELNQQIQELREIIQQMQKQIETLRPSNGNSKSLAKNQLIVKQGSFDLDVMTSATNDNQKGERVQREKSVLNAQRNPHNSTFLTKLPSANPLR